MRSRLLLCFAVALTVLRAASALAQAGAGPLPGMAPGLFLAPSVPIGTPVFIGANNNTGGTTTIAKATTASAPVGSVVVVSIGWLLNGSLHVTGVSDGTNTYTAAVSSTSGGEVWKSGILTGTLASNTTITVTFSGTPIIAEYLSIAYVTGLSSAAADKTASADAGTGSSYSVSTGTLGKANEVVFGNLIIANVSGETITEGAGFTTIDHVNGFGASGQESYTFAYKIVSSTASVTYNPTSNLASAAGAICVASFKGF